MLIKWIYNNKTWGFKSSVCGLAHTRTPYHLLTDRCVRLGNFQMSKIFCHICECVCVWCVQLVCVRFEKFVLIAYRSGKVLWLLPCIVHVSCRRSEQWNEPCIKRRNNKHTRERKWNEVVHWQKGLASLSVYHMQRERESECVLRAHNYESLEARLDASKDRETLCERFIRKLNEIHISCTHTRKKSENKQTLKRQFSD